VGVTALDTMKGIETMPENEKRENGQLSTSSITIPFHIIPITTTFTHYL
jgi:hypothetical protein